MSSLSLTWQPDTRTATVHMNSPFTFTGGELHALLDRIDALKPRFIINVIDGQPSATHSPDFANQLRMVAEVMDDVAEMKAMLNVLRLEQARRRRKQPPSDTGRRSNGQAQQDWPLAS